LNLILCEKPSAARQISSVLGAKMKRGGYFEGNGYLVSWCLGHLVELAAPKAYDERYDKWNLTDLPVIPAVWKHFAVPDKMNQIDILHKLMQNAQVNTVINACDAGREGELIFRLVYDYCACDKPVQRLWISSMEEKAIKTGFETLKPGADYDALFQSALCRSQAD